MDDHNQFIDVDIDKNFGNHMDAQQDTRKEEEIQTSRSQSIKTSNLKGRNDEDNFSTKSKHK